MLVVLDSRAKPWALDRAGLQATEAVANGVRSASLTMQAAVGYLGVSTREQGRSRELGLDAQRHVQRARERASNRHPISATRGPSSPP